MMKSFGIGAVIVAALLRKRLDPGHRHYRYPVCPWVDPAQETRTPEVSSGDRVLRSKHMSASPFALSALQSFTNAF